MAKTKEDRIKTVYGGGGHVVIFRPCWSYHQHE